MQEIQAQDQGRAGSKDSAGVIYFASQVVSLLAERNWRTFSELREPVVSGLITAALSGKKDAFADLLRELKKARVSAAALADLYIPEAARRMGDAWTDDQMSWLDVSIGVGRLQSLLREIGMAWVADQAGDTGHGTVLLIVPDREQHTLGPMVAMGQMRRYGVSVCLRIAPSHNELRSLMAARQFDGVLISIATKDKLESVFDSFSQGSIEINRKYGGTGLGLSIVKRLTDILGGTISLVSQVGIGSTFTVVLPFKISSDNDIQHNPFAYNDQILNGKKVLLIEDNKINQMITKKMVENKAMVCEVIDNGEDAIQAVKNNRYDLVLMDVHLPGINGTIATQTIRTFDPKTKIIALTAISLNENREMLLSYGMNDVITKPFNPEEFYHIICKNLDA